MSSPSRVSPAPDPVPVPAPPSVIQRLGAAVGPANVIHEAVDLRTYECDALTSFRASPSVVVLPASTEEVAAVVRIAREAGMPVVPRGAGTGLSGGALPVPGCVLLGLSRMKRILEVNLDDGSIRVQPGVINLDVSKEISAAGYYYAPDPSSQSVCTIGGNVAENSGGAHCLKYGFTVNHVLGCQLVTADGAVIDLGGPALDTPGFDLLGVVVGSEGTLGIVTEVTLRILRKPEATRTFFATFPSTTEAGNCVSEIISTGIVPAAIEMMDRLAIQAAVAATGLDWPDVGAALLMDVDGCSAESEHTSKVAVEIARRTGALEIRVPRSEDERMLMWKGRKSAFAAMGRLGPQLHRAGRGHPRNDIGRVLAEIARLSEERGLRVANVFHAGDGNLHPLVLYDARIAGRTTPPRSWRGDPPGSAFATAVRSPASTGWAADKAPYMAEMFSGDGSGHHGQGALRLRPGHDLQSRQGVPTRGCAATGRGSMRRHPTETAGLADRG